MLRVRFIMQRLTATRSGVFNSVWMDRHITATLHPVAVVECGDDAPKTLKMEVNASAFGTSFCRSALFRITDLAASLDPIVIVMFGQLAVSSWGVLL